MTTQVGTTYQLEGRLLEVCNCGVLCPWWVGADPDGGACDTTIGWHIDSGAIQGVDVSGLTIALSAHVPGNILKGNWRALVYVDDQATPAQQDALLSVFTGKLGGPIADLAALIGEVVGVERVPITFTIQQGKGTLIGSRCCGPGCWSPLPGRCSSWQHSPIRRSCLTITTCCKPVASPGLQHWKSSCSAGR